MLTIKKILCVLLTVVLLASAGSFAVSANEPFVVPGFEWTGLEVSIYPAPLLMINQHYWDDGSTVHTFGVQPGAMVTVDVIGDPVGTDLLQVRSSHSFVGPKWGMYGGWYFFSPYYTSPDGVALLGPPPWTIPAVYCRFGEWSLAAEALDYYFRFARAAVMRIRILGELPIHADFAMPEPFINTSANTVTFDIGNLSTEPRTVKVFSANFGGLNRFLNVSPFVTVEIPPGESRPATVGFNANSRIFIWCADTMQPIIEPFSP